MCVHDSTWRKHVLAQALIQFQRDDVEHMPCVQRHHAVSSMSSRWIWISACATTCLRHALSWTWIKSLFLFSLHKKYSRGFIKLQLTDWCHMDHFVDHLGTFLDLDRVRTLAVYGRVRELYFCRTVFLINSFNKPIIVVAFGALTAVLFLWQLPPQQTQDINITSSWRWTWRWTDIAFRLRMIIGLMSVFDTN